MADQLTVIYAARTVEQAYLLKNLLEDQGIGAVVTNEVLAGGAGVEILGWPTQPRVAVAAGDAESARQIALQFDATVAAEPELAAEAEAGVKRDAEEDGWPQCPQCDARRPARCPICETTSTDFPPSDPDYLAASQPVEGSEPHACGCGSGGCSTQAGPDEQAASAAAAAEPDEDQRRDGTEAEPQSPPLTVICTTCDEPFEPEFPNRCQWCGHQFPDGYEVAPEQLYEPISGRTIAVILVMIALGAALAIYFKLVV